MQKLDNKYIYRNAKKLYRDAKRFHRDAKIR